MDENLNVLFDANAVDEVIKGIANTFNKTANENLCFVFVLKGGVYFGMKLQEYITLDVPYGFVGLSSYKAEKKSQGSVDVTSDLDFPEGFLQGKDVWIIDDVIEVGDTLLTARMIVDCWEPASVHTAVLVNKDFPRLVGNGKADVFGFTVDKDKFLVGCGMGMGEQYRSLPCLCEYTGE